MYSDLAKIEEEITVVSPPQPKNTSFLYINLLIKLLSFFSNFLSVTWLVRSIPFWKKYFHFLEDNNDLNRKKIVNYVITRKL